MKRKIVGGAVAAILLSLVGLVAMMRDDPKSASATGHERPAAVALVTRRSLGQSVTLAAEFKPFQEVDVHAKVAGYIRTISVDVGDRVKAGQVLAVLEVPELTAQLTGAEAATRRSRDEIERAQGDLERAESAHAAVHSGAVRLKQASEARPGLVAQQELDDEEAKDREAEAQIASDKAALSAARQQLAVAEAERQQLAALSDYSRITAPLTGVITRRYADTGALIQAGTASNTQAMPVVRLAETSKLRLVVPVPESAVPDVKVGEPVKVHVQALDRDFQGKVSRFADALDRQTRTMETEIDFDNPDGVLVPGMYAEAVFVLKQQDGALAVPVQAVERDGDQATVLVVDNDDRVQLRNVKLGLEGNAWVQVVSGLQERERVVIGDRSQFRQGERVAPRPADPKLLAPEG